MRRLDSALSTAFHQWAVYILIIFMWGITIKAYAEGNHKIDVMHYILPPVSVVILSFLITAMALFAHHIYSRCIVIEFATHHRLCGRCQRRHRTCCILVSILHKILFAALVLLLCLTVPAVVFGVAMPFIAREEAWLFPSISIIGVGLIAPVVWGFEACRKLIIPPSLRKIGRFPFFLYALRRAT